MSQTVNWMFNMYQVERSRGPGETPGDYTRMASNVYFLVTMMFCAFFIINMFVAGVCESYNA